MDRTAIEGKVMIERLGIEYWFEKKICKSALQSAEICVKTLLNTEAVESAEVFPAVFRRFFR